MSTTFYVDKKEYSYDRMFSSSAHPTVMESNGGFFYYASEEPIKTTSELAWLPEPHRARALAWHDKMFPRADVAVAVMEPEEEASGASEGDLICDICEFSAKSTFGLQVHRRKHGS